MKQALIIAIAMASITAFAQTQTAPAAATTAAPAAATEQVAPATPVKKAKKLKAAKKKATKPSAQAPAVAPVAPATTAAPAVAPATTTAAPAAATSATSAAAPAAPTKNWSASFVTQATAGNDIVRLPIDKVPVESINFIGAGYKVTADTKVGVRQYFSYNFTPDQVAQGNAQWTVATVGTKFKGILGSDDIAPLFWYYLPTETALKHVYNTEAGAIANHNGVLRMDAEIVWTLNPKWQVSYYLNPRQSLVKKQDYQDLDGATKQIEATTTLIHYGYLYYNVNDNNQFYALAGMDQRATTRDLRSIKDHALLGVGAAFTILGGKVIINPEIDNEVALKDNGEYAAAPRWLQAEDMSYILTGVVQF